MARGVCGRVVIVTGAGAGLGRAIVAAFLEHGARVVGADVDEDALGSIDGALGLRCDVSDPAGVEAMVAAVLARYGRVDVLVNNAGVTSVHPFTELPEGEWDRVMAINAKGSFLCAQAVARQMLQQAEGGAIVNVSSQAGWNGEAMIAHYCASKAAVIGLTRSLARELAPTIRVNCVCPGSVETEMLIGTQERQAAALGIDRATLVERLCERIPVGRLQRPQEVADAILFLAGDGASALTGQCLQVSGGMVMS